MRVGSGTIALGLALLSVTEAVPANKRQDQGEADGSSSGESPIWLRDVERLAERCDRTLTAR